MKIPRIGWRGCFHKVQTPFIYMHVYAPWASYIGAILPQQARKCIALTKKYNRGPL